MNEFDASPPPKLLQTTLPPSTLDAYFSVRWVLDRKTEACKCLQNAVELTRAATVLNPLDDDLSANLARWLEQLGIHVKSAAMDTFDVLPLWQEAVKRCRLLYDQDQTRHREAFARTLLRYGSALGLWGQRDEALKAVQEASVLYQQLMAECPSFTPSLAGSFHNLSTDVSNVVL